MAQMMSVGLSREASTYMYCLLNFCVQISQTIIHLNGLCQRIKNPLTQHLLWNKLCCRLWCDGKKLSGSCLFSHGGLQEGWRLWFSSLGVRLHCVTQTALTVMAEYVLVPLHFFFSFILQSSVLGKHLLLSCFCCMIFLGAIVCTVLGVRLSVVLYLVIGIALLSNIPAN